MKKIVLQNLKSDIIAEMIKPETTPERKLYLQRFVRTNGWLNGTNI